MAFFEEAIGQGHNHVIRWMESKLQSFNMTPYSVMAAKSGNLGTMKLFQERGCPLTAQCYIAAVENAHIDMLKYLEEHNCPLPAHEDSPLICAVKSGSVPAINWCLDHGFKWNKSKAYSFHTIETLEFCLKNDFTGSISLDDAIRAGNLPLIKHCTQLGVEMGKFSYKTALEHGQIEIMRYLASEFVHVYTSSSELDSVDVLRQLKKDGGWCEANSLNCAEKSQFTCLRWLVENFKSDYKHNNKIYEKLAAANYGDVLAWYLNAIK